MIKRYAAIAVICTLGASISVLSSLPARAADDVPVGTEAGPGIHEDPAGMVFIAEPRTAFPPVVGTKRLEDEVPSVLIDSAFRLHSRPGSDRTIMLDFDGGLVSATAWNEEVHAGADVVAAPFDADGDPSTFNSAERAIVVEVWQRVSEDFAPFDIDVTTEAVAADLIDRTSEADQRFGTTVMITPTDVVPACVCAGLSYVGVFDRPGDHRRYQPSFVFQSALGVGAHNLAEASSHEAGHTLGLLHVLSASGDYDAGQGPWAPIMGTSYYRPVTQWFSGEHNGGAGVMDQLAVMAAHGATPAPDDHRDEPYRATPLGAGPGALVEGVIATAADVDQFSFTTAGGPVSFAARPASIGADLDLDLRLTTVSGQLIVGSDPMVGMVDNDRSTGLDAALSADLAPGTYVVRVAGARPAGVGGLVPTGRYTLTGSFAVSTNLPPVPIVTVQANSWAPPAELHFSSAASSDPDGSIRSVTWDFGDGTSSNGVSPTKTYASAGSYTAVVTVRDNQGGVASAAVLVTIGEFGGTVGALDAFADATTARGADRVSASPTVEVAAAQLPDAATTVDSQASVAPQPSEVSGVTTARQRTVSPAPAVEYATPARTCVPNRVYARGGAGGWIAAMDIVLRERAGVDADGSWACSTGITVRH